MTTDVRFLFVMILQLLISAFVSGQATFWADGKEYKTGTIEKSYDFGYSLGDSVTISLWDSVYVYTNVEKTLVKSDKNFFTGEVSSTRCIIEYFNSTGLDSIRREYENDQLSMVYNWQYDSLRRVISYSSKYCKDDYDEVLIYLYSDSLTKDGIASVKTLYANGRFYFRYLSYYDEKNRIVKEVRERMVADSNPYILKFAYDDSDSLTSVTDNSAIPSSAVVKHLPRVAGLQDKIIESEYEFSSVDYLSIRKLALQLLNDNIEYLENYSNQNALKFISTNKQTTLIIHLMETWCMSRTVYYTTMQKY